MGNILQTASTSPTLSHNAYKVATFANVAAVLSIIGTVAGSVGNSQSLLNTAFGSSRGALIAVILIAVSHAATTIAAYGAPAGSTGATIQPPTP